MTITAKSKAVLLAVTKVTKLGLNFVICEGNAY